MSSRLGALFLPAFFFTADFFTADFVADDVFADDFFAARFAKVSSMRCLYAKCQLQTRMTGSTSAPPLRSGRALLSSTTEPLVSAIR
jgi:hypothetical protein